jgi:hypothetical protein
VGILRRYKNGIKINLIQIGKDGRWLERPKNRLHWRALRWYMYCHVSGVWGLIIAGVGLDGKIY